MKIKTLIFNIGLACMVCIFGFILLSSKTASAACIEDRCAEMVSAGGHGQPAVVSATNRSNTT